MTVKVLKRLKIVAIFVQRWRQFQGVSRLSVMMPQTALQRHLLGNSLKNLTGEVKKSKKKKVRAIRVSYKGTI